VTAQVLAVSVSLPKDVEINGHVIRTGIFKTPVDGRRLVSATNIDGDGQADLTVHGGPAKAVYVYPSEHYPPWREELGEALPVWGAFGENLTTAGLVETDVHVGDRFRIGSAEFVVTQPRMPCFKLGIRFGRSDILQRFAEADRSGFYLAVEREGEVGAGDEVVRLSRDLRLSIASVYRLKIDGGDRDLMEVAAAHPALARGWRDHFRQRLDRGVPRR
jgi:MOSC domain-containing protein YiiM